MAVFEVSAHPYNSTARSIASLSILDAILRTLSLTTIDADDPSVLLFDSRTPGGIKSKLGADAVSNPQARIHRVGTAWQISPDHGPCECWQLSLGQTWAAAAEHTPLWLSTPAWDVTWNDHEVRKESCRRLVWSTVLLTAAHSSYTVAHRNTFSDFYVSDPSNVRALYSTNNLGTEIIQQLAILFPGEALTLNRSASRNSMWALHCRTMLLWHSCVRMRHDSITSDGEKAQYGIAAWQQVEILENALNGHTCGLERSFLFQAREYLFK